MNFSFLILAAKQESMSLPSMLIMGGLWLAILYFLMIRPNQNKRKKQQELLSELQKGADVILYSGLFGKIVSIKDTSIELEIANNCIVKVHRNAISGLADQADERMEEESKK